jgi:hypothetical protein
MSNKLKVTAAILTGYLLLLFTFPFASALFNEINSDDSSFSLESKYHFHSKDLLTDIEGLISFIELEEEEDIFTHAFQSFHRYNRNYYPPVKKYVQMPYTHLSFSKASQRQTFLSVFII